MPCSRCGQSNASGALYCIRCGQPLAPVGNAAPAEQSASFSAAPLPSSAIPFQAPPALNGPSASGAGNGAVGANVPPVPVRGKSVSAELRAQARASGQNAPQEFPCRVCGARVSARRAVCAVCGTPLGMTVNPNDSAAATYFPAGYAALLGESGRAKDAVEFAPGYTVPGEVSRRRWHWGAFGLSSLWLLKHRLSGWGLIALGLTLLSPLAYFGPLGLSLPISGLLLSLLFGVRGGRIAWRQGAYSDLPAFVRDDEHWQWAGVAASVVKTLALLALTTFALRR